MKDVIQEITEKKDIIPKTNTTFAHEEDNQNEEEF